MVHNLFRTDKVGNQNIKRHFFFNKNVHLVLIFIFMCKCKVNWEERDENNLNSRRQIFLKGFCLLQRKLLF